MKLLIKIFLTCWLSILANIVLGQSLARLTISSGAFGTFYNMKSQQRAGFIPLGAGLTWAPFNSDFMNKFHIGVEGYLNVYDPTFVFHDEFTGDERFRVVYSDRYLGGVVQFYSYDSDNDPFLSYFASAGVGYSGNKRREIILENGTSFDITEYDASLALNGSAGFALRLANIFDEAAGLFLLASFKFNYYNPWHTDISSPTESIENNFNALSYGGELGISINLYRWD